MMMSAGVSPNAPSPTPSLASEAAVEILRAAGEATRLRILALLAREELAVLELARILQQSQPRVSRHLKLLAEAGLAERFPDGAWVFYRLPAAGPARALLATLLAEIAPDDATLGADAARLADIAAERAAAAARYFADNAERWDDIRSLYVDESEVEAAILAAAGEGPYRRLVDLGTGTGRMLTLLAARARAALGLDLSRQMLGIARLRTAGVPCELRHGDILATGLPAGEADLVLVHQVLHYLTDPAAAAAEAARLVAPGGRLIVVDFAPHGLEFLRAEHAHRRLGFADAELSAWLAAAGLPSVSVATLPSNRGLTVKIWTAQRSANNVTPHPPVAARRAPLSPSGRGVSSPLPQGEEGPIASSPLPQGEEGPIASSPLPQGEEGPIAKQWGGEGLRRPQHLSHRGGGQAKHLSHREREGPAPKAREGEGLRRRRKEPA